MTQSNKCTFQFIAPHPAADGSDTRERASGWWMVGVGCEGGEASPRADVRPACWEMARSDAPCRRARFVKVGTGTRLHRRAGMCCFSNRWQRSGDCRERTEDRVGRRGDDLWVFFPLFPSHLYDFCILFTHNHCLGTETWQILFLFVSRQWFDIVSASVWEPRWPTDPLLLNVQWLKKKSPLWFSLQLYEIASSVPNVLEARDGPLCSFSVGPVLKSALCCF